MIIDLQQKRIERSPDYEFIGVYSYNDKLYEISVIAKDFDEAAEHLAAIGETGIIEGVVV